MSGREEHVAFDTSHPAVPAVYFVGAILMTALAVQPVLVAISLAGALAFSASARGLRATVRGLRWQLPLLALICLINPLFSSTGSTLLCHVGHIAVYAESLAYGACMGALMVATLLWLEGASRVLTHDRLLELGARAMPTVSLMLSMASQLVPQLVRRSNAVRAAREATSAAARGGARERGVLVSGVLMSWAMEDSLERSDAMRCRGWGAGGSRTSYQPDEFRGSDAAALAAVCALLVVCVPLARTACLQWRFYPTMPRPVAWWGYLPFALLYALPTALGLRERMRWWRLS